MIKIEGVSKSYSDNRILENINIQFEDGKIYCIMGESGVGKTTLLKLIMGLEKPDSGNITVSGTLGAVFQEDRLLMERTAVDNIYFVTGHGGYFNDREKIRESLSMILPRDCHDKPVSQLSGGMKRRVALARAFLSDRQVLLLDEPFTGLDQATRQRTGEFIQKYQKGRTVVVITHEKQDVDMLHAGICLLTMGKAIDTMIRGFDISEV